MPHTRTLLQLMSDIETREKAVVSRFSRFEDSKKAMEDKAAQLSEIDRNIAEYNALLSKRAQQLELMHAQERFPVATQHLPHHVPFDSAVARSAQVSSSSLASARHTPQSAPAVAAHTPAQARMIASSHNHAYGLSGTNCCR